MKVDVYLKQARRNVKRDSYPLPDGFSPPCLSKDEALDVARLLIREGYPPPLVFETLQVLDVEGGEPCVVLAYVRHLMIEQLDEKGIVDPNAGDSLSELPPDPDEWH